MTVAGRAAMRQAMATAGTALAVGALHVPQPFLAVLAAQLTAGIGFSGPGGFLKRIAAAWAGSLCGVFLLSAAPDQPWISLPLFGVAAGFGTALVSRRMGPGPAILFAMGIGGMFAAGIVYPARGLMEGAAHASSLSIAAAVTFLASAIFPAGAGAGPQISAWQVGLSGAVALVAACATLPSQSVVMSIAAMTTALSLEPGARGFFFKVAGGVLGVLASIAFLILVPGAGNDLAGFLVALALVLGGLESLAVVHPDRSAMFRQAGAMFAIASTMFPRPEASLAGPGERMLAVFLGLVIAAAISLVCRNSDGNRDATDPAQGECGS